MAEKLLTARLGWTATKQRGKIPPDGGARC
jgi:hypothetical protein